MRLGIYHHTQRYLDCFYADFSALHKMNGAK